MMNYRLFIINCALCIATSVLLPLVNLLSYRWTLAEVLHKIPRLVHGGTAQAVGYVLVVGNRGLKLALWRHRCGVAVRLLPLLSALLLAACLLLSSKPVAPGIGLWIYILLALALSMGTRK